MIHVEGAHVVGGMDFSIWQIAIVLVIALLVFGPKRLPELGRSLGNGLREFKGSITGDNDDEADDAEKGSTRTIEGTATAEPVVASVAADQQA